MSKVLVPLALVKNQGFKNESTKTVTGTKPYTQDDEDYTMFHHAAPEWLTRALRALRGRFALPTTQERTMELPRHSGEPWEFVTA